MSQDAAQLRPSTKPLDPAHSIIERLGGREFVSAETEIPAFTLRRWTQPVALGGTGGEIPRKRHAVLMALAERQGVKLERWEFFGPLEPLRMAS